MHVKLECKNFSGPFQGVNGTSPSFSCTQLDLARGIVTAGKMDASDVMKGGFARLLEMTSHIFATYAYTSEDKDGLGASGHYWSVDGSEKTGVSYRIGMGMAKLVAEEKLGAPWLRHLDLMWKNDEVKLLAGSKERADMLGQDLLGRWHIIEAKGRSGGPSTAAMTKAKAQASRIVEVNGLPPATTSGCVTSLRSRPFSVVLDDPPRPVDERFPETRLVVQEGRFLLEYYRTMSAFRERGAEVREAHLRWLPGAPLVEFVDLPGGYRLGIEADILRAMDDGGHALWEGLGIGAEMRRMRWAATRNHPSTSVGLDGVVLEKVT